ncbi:response regulator [Parasediminibacterium sp. JCM 36343]|uniref:response regulator n=1 Tax=Parasediminibacterium sp. JCM 36343 TaxID=3374279 RepID=UPI003979047D
MENLKVLIVDDDPVVVLMHKRIVANCNLSNAPLTFKNGKEAFEYISNTNDNSVYLVLLDINMPVMNGWDFLNSIQEMPNDSRFFVMMVSSSVSEPDKEKAKEYSQVIGYLEKNLNATVCKEIKNIDAISHFFTEEA